MCLRVTGLSGSLRWDSKCRCLIKYCVAQAGMLTFCLYVSSWLRECWFSMSLWWIQAGVFYCWPLIGSIQTETWPSQQISVRLPKTCTHSHTHIKSECTALPPVVFHCKCFTTVSSSWCVSCVWPWQAYLIFCSIIWSLKLKWLTHLRNHKITFKRKI